MMNILQFTVFFIVLSSISAASRKALVEKRSVLFFNSNNSSASYGKLFGTGCQCVDYNCGCCAHLEIERVGLNDTGCVNLTYLPKDYGISFTVTIDKLTVFNETISARDPPPYCFGAPMIKDYADLCIHFYDLSLSTDHFHGCVDLEARINHVRVGKYTLGCFNIGGKTFYKVKSNRTQYVNVQLI